MCSFTYNNTTQNFIPYKEFCFSYCKQKLVYLFSTKYGFNSYEPKYLEYPFYKFLNILKMRKIFGKLFHI